jgi:hypothetical protein
MLPQSKTAERKWVGHMGNDHHTNLFACIIYHFKGASKVQKVVNPANFATKRKAFKNSKRTQMKQFWVFCSVVPKNFSL